MIGGPFAVCDQKDTSALFNIASQVIKHNISIIIIQVPGWFISHNDFGIVEKGTGQGGSLPFSCAELAWNMEELCLSVKGKHILILRGRALFQT